MNVRLFTLFAPTLTIFGCAEPIAPSQSDELHVSAPSHSPLVVGPIRHSQGTGEYWESGPQEAPDGVPVEYQVQGNLRIEPGASFISQTTSSATALGEVVVRYFGTGASAKVLLSVTKGDVAVGTPAKGEASRSGGLPIHSDLYASAQVNVSGPCGYAARADTEGSAWLGYLDQKWGVLNGTAQATAEQPACSNGGGGGSRGYTLIICETTYYYYGNEYLGDSQTCSYEEHLYM